ncbi:hypothetical protein KYC5002_34520 [Archangium violaceum]|uniref:hypothetical protein n=1 Tax=Archangium violaceum TaxID=83451 RepID=UPI002B2B47CF|nr:hypothetical protein KYC5002_34520 [Archangium gephyra]
MNQALTTLVAVLALSSTAFAADTYKVVVTPPTSATKGKPAVVLVHIEGAGGAKVNLEYPTKLEITPPTGVTVAKSRLTAKDAKKFNKDGADFEISFTSSSAGVKTFTGEVKFAVATETNAVPVTEKLNFSVNVK